MADDLKPLAWVTGAGGLIGSYLLQTAPQWMPGWEILSVTRREADLARPETVCALWQRLPPQLVVHCAAMSKSPACQAEPKLAWQVNVDATKLLSELASDIPFIFFSTDLVFDGRKGDYLEADQPNPLSVYAETKVAAESFVLRNPKHTVVRTSLNGGKSPTGDRSFTEEMRNAWRAGKTLKLFVDEFRSPIPASFTARAVWELASGHHAGVFHVAGKERLSRYEIGQLLASFCMDVNPGFEASSLRDYQGAPRPPDTSLNCDKIQRLLSFELPRFSDWVKRAGPELR